MSITITHRRLARAILARKLRAWSGDDGRRARPIRTDAILGHIEGGEELVQLQRRIRQRIWENRAQWAATSTPWEHESSQHSLFKKAP